MSEISVRDAKSDVRAHEAARRDASQSLLHEAADTARLQSGKSRGKSQSSDEKKTKWTIAIEMSADREAAAGTPARMEALRKLAIKTATSPVAFIVDSVSEVPITGAAKNSHGQIPTREDRQRYVIKGGTIKLVSDEDSKGLGNDISSLLKDAQQLAPSAKLGLWLSMHGDAADGLSGFSGTLTPDQLVKTVSDSLDPTEHKKLDFIDFDACKMGNLTVLDRVSKIAAHAVASEYEEFNDSKNKQFFGQNTEAALKSLLANPDMSAADLARTIVGQAKSGANDGTIATEYGNMRTGTPTLASFDLSKVKEFESHLNDLGKALKIAMKDPNNAKAIDAAIKGSPCPGDEWEGAAINRDLSIFAKNILRQIAVGALKDKDHILYSATKRMLESEKRVRIDKFGTPDRGFDQWGAMSTFLPSLEFRAEGPQSMVRQHVANGVGVPVSKPPGDDDALKKIYTDNRLSGAPDWDSFLGLLPAK